jgi:uncharacterized protein (UPF0548 family)
MTFTYPDVGASRDGPLPPGYDHTVRRVQIGTGEAAFQAGAEALASWRAPHVGAGLRMRVGASKVAPGVRFRSGVGVGPLRLWAPCEVIWVIDEPDRYGFGFGTLPGHPEAGEESFVLTLQQEAVMFDVRAFSRPAHWWVRIGHPVARRLQARITDGYVTAMRAAVSA